MVVTGKSIYPHRPGLYSKYFYLCADCNAYVGCHAGGDGKQPLGRLANSELRTAKQAAHAAIDPHWRTGKLSRKEVYKRLANLLAIPIRETHIGMFDVEQCRKVVRLGTTAANWNK
jgi:hypothetical protein